MHELSIALSLIDVACEEAERRRARVVALHLKVGPLSGVVTQALVSAYELARERTPLEQARLEIEETPVLMNCRACEAERPVASLQELRCAECGAPAVEIISGRELELTALEIE
jgi:hydrogenase nickel incorporation protein HypA/HybF